MSEPIWNKFLTERDKAVFAAAGYGARAGFGKRPALLVIDVSYAFAGDDPDEPILESIKRWRNSCGAESWVAIAHIKRLIDKAHEKELPVIYTTESGVPICGIPAAGPTRIRAAARRPRRPRTATAMTSWTRSRPRRRIW